MIGPDAPGLLDREAGLGNATVGQQHSRIRQMAIGDGVDARDRIAQAIADWRDGDDLHRARGAEVAWYEEEGRFVLPRNGPFADVPVV